MPALATKAGAAGIWRWSIRANRFRGLRRLSSGGREFAKVLDRQPGFSEPFPPMIGLAVAGADGDLHFRQALWVKRSRAPSHGLIETLLHKVVAGAKLAMASGENSEDRRWGVAHIFVDR
jgi:hypothetical protein